MMSNTFSAWSNICRCWGSYAHLHVELVSGLFERVVQGGPFLSLLAAFPTANDQLRHDSSAVGLGAHDPLYPLVRESFAVKFIFSKCTAVLAHDFEGIAVVGSPL
jgi:hypothetical protein